jgi:hypothetical protein
LMDSTAVLDDARGWCPARNWKQPGRGLPSVGQRRALRQHAACCPGEHFLIKQRPLSNLCPGASRAATNSRILPRDCACSLADTRGSSTTITTLAAHLDPVHQGARKWQACLLAALADSLPAEKGIPAGVRSWLLASHFHGIARRQASAARNTPSSLSRRPTPVAFLRWPRDTDKLELTGEAHRSWNCAVRRSRGTLRCTPAGAWPLWEVQMGSLISLAASGCCQMLPNLEPADRLKARKLKTKRG